MALNNRWTQPVSQRAAALGEEIRRQSQPRRWFWQEKTIRDLLDERRADLADVALSRSAQLAAAAAEQRDTLLTELQRQAQPRRWPWQQRTAYDRFAAQRERLASNAVERANALTEAATTRRDLLVAEALRHSQPRRWPWQEKTLRDKFEDQKQSLRAQTKPSRWPWQEDTLRDRFDQRRENLRGQLDQRRGELRDQFDQQRENLRDQFDQRREEVRGTIADTLPAIQDSATAAAERVRLGARSTADLVQNQIAQAPQLLGQAADSLRENADQATQRVRERAEQAAQTARSAALAPVEAVRESVESGQQALSDTVNAGKRSARRSVRVGRVFLWALLIGTVVGVLLAPRTGEETRRNLLALWNRIMETVAPSS